MDHPNTIPSVLGPISGPQGFVARQDARSQQAQSGGLLKVAFWIAVGMLAVAVARHFLH